MFMYSVSLRTSIGWVTVNVEHRMQKVSPLAIPSLDRIGSSAMVILFSLPFVFSQQVLMCSAMSCWSFSLVSEMS